MGETVIEKRSVYQPLDHSQIESIAEDLESLIGSLAEEASREVDAFGGFLDAAEGVALDDDLVSFIEDEEEGDASSASDSMKKMSSRYTPNTPYMSSDDSVSSETYRKLRSGNTNNPHLVESVRYKIILRLNKRDMRLLRTSWLLMLDENLEDKEGSLLYYSLLNGTRDKLNSYSPFDVARFSGSPDDDDYTIDKVMAMYPRKVTIADSLFFDQFYANMIALDPSIEQILPTLKHQALGFAGVLNKAIENLENMEAMDAYLLNLGKRHSRILGIETANFELMGMAFLNTIRDRIGIYSTMELETIWSKLYSYLANSILQFGMDPVLSVELQERKTVFATADHTNDTAKATPVLRPSKSGAKNKYKNSEKAVASSVSSKSASKRKIPRVKAGPKEQTQSSKDQKKSASSTNITSNSKNKNNCVIM